MNGSFPRVLAGILPVAIAITACSGGGPASVRTTPAPDAGPARRLSPAEMVRADSGRPPYTRADVHFMSGMIGHHAQAVLIAGWAPTHGAGPSVRGLCERIVVAQRDEIGLMQTWLRARRETVPAADGSGGHQMPGMDHSMMMPGMLTPDQLAQLDRARGTEFDQLFLTFMIQHHQGALTMVDELMNAHGAAQDDTVFKFAADVSADQSTEINRMQLMLEALAGKPASR